MGLGLLYGGLRLRPGDEILTSEHDHYSTYKAAHGAPSAAARACARFDSMRTAVAPARGDRRRAQGGDRSDDARRRADMGSLVQRGQAADPGDRGRDRRGQCQARCGRSDPLLRRWRARVRHRGRAGRGARLRRLRGRLPQVAVRTARHRHRVGATGRLAADQRDDPSFEKAPFKAFRRGQGDPAPSRRRGSSRPGGFHRFEHRFALPAAFELQQSLGRGAGGGTHSRARQRREGGLRGMKHVTLHTPMSPDLSAGIVCYEVAA